MWYFQVTINVVIVKTSMTTTHLTTTITAVSSPVAAAAVAGRWFSDSSYLHSGKIFDKICRLICSAFRSTSAN